MEESAQTNETNGKSGKDTSKRTVEEDNETTNDNGRKKIKLEDEIKVDTLKYPGEVRDEKTPENNEEQQENAENNEEQQENAENNEEQQENAENNEEQQENVELKNESLETAKSGINFSKKKKCALLLSYCGSGYNGMQRNPGVRTIEEDLTNALFKANAISEDALRNFGKHMVPSKELLPEINKHLEPQIRVFDLKRVTRGFDCKSRCSSRTYEYLVPTFAFSQSYAHTTPSFRITKEIMDRINETLSRYVGTHNFHNFTSGRGFGEESSKRYMMSFKIAGEPFVGKDMEFLVLQVEGQSFMQHQIRKMIGLLIAIIRNVTGEDAIERSFEEAKMDIPKAPGLGLILDQVHFKSYNEKFGKDGIHERLEWSEHEEKIVEFKKNFIYSNIIETEVKTKSMMRWLSTLATHTYSSAGMLKRDIDKNTGEEEENDSSNCIARTVSLGESKEDQ